MCKIYKFLPLYNADIDFFSRKVLVISKFSGYILSQCRCTHFVSLLQETTVSAVNMLYPHPSTKSFKSTCSTLRGSNVLAVNTKSGNNSAERYSSWPPILSEAQSLGRTRKISEASFTFHIYPQFCQKRFFGCVLSLHIVTFNKKRN